jgi:hypothetical protein
MSGMPDTKYDPLATQRGADIEPLGDPDRSTWVFLQRHFIAGTLEGAVRE